MKQAAYKAVLFDLDDTLVKTWESKWAQHKLIAKQYYDVDLTDDMLREHWGKGFDEMIGHLYNHGGTTEEMRQNYLRHEKEFPKQVHDDAVLMAEQLHEAGVILGVVTSMRTETAEIDLKEQGLPYEKFSIIQGCDQTHVHKPDPGVFEPTLAYLKTLKIEDGILYVGDALNDYYAAKGAGMDFVGVTTGFANESSFRKAGAKRVVGRLSELAPLILMTT